MVLADRPTTSRWTPGGADAPIRPGRSSKARTEADTSSARTLSPRSIAFGARPRFSLRPYANRRPRGQPKFNTGIAFAPAGLGGAVEGTCAMPRTRSRRRRGHDDRSDAHARSRYANGNGDHALVHVPIGLAA